MSRRIVRHERRVQILEALKVCMTRKSFYETTIKDIAVEAGLPSGVIHYYFKSKEEILLYYIDRIIELTLLKMSDWLASTELDGLTPKQCFTEIFNLVKQAITLDQDLTTNFIELWEIALHKPEVREKVKKAYDIWAEHLSALLERISDDREWTTWLSTALIAFLEGVCVLSAVYGQDSPLVRNLLDNFEKYHLAAFTRNR